MADTNTSWSSGGDAKRENDVKLDTKKTKRRKMSTSALVSCKRGNRKKKDKVEAPRCKCVCGKFYSTNSLLIRHQRTIHGEKFLLETYKCHEPGCKKPRGPKTPAELKRHFLKLHSKNFLCTCKRLFTSKHRLFQHHANDHDSDFQRETYRCQEPGCPKARGSTSQSELNAHKRTYHSLYESRNHKCPLCLQFFRCKEDLQYHVKNRHKNENHEMVTEKASLKTQKTKGIGLNIMKSKTSNEIGKNQDKIGDGSFECKCGKKFTRKEYLFKHHRLNHTKKFRLDTYECKEPGCEKPRGSKNQKELKIHIRIFHARCARLNIKCSNCGVFCTSAQDLKKHLETHKSKPQPDTENANTTSVGNDQVQVRPHKCKKCGKTFSSELKLNVHDNKIHRDDLPKKCKLCHKQVPNLMEHFVKSHDMLKEFPQMCIGCGFTSKQLYGLDLHVANIHKDDPEIIKFYYTCVVCQETFKNKSEITDHQKRRHVAGASECVVCHLPLCNKWSMAVHVKKVHGLNHPEITKLFTCTKGCRHVAKNLSGLRKHHLKHKSDKIICIGCNWEVERGQISAHIHNKHKDDVSVMKHYYSCTHDGCSLWFKNHRDYKSHLYTHDPRFDIKRQRCYKCKTNYAYPSMKGRHDMLQHGHHKLRCLKLSGGIFKRSNKTVRIKGFRVVEFFKKCEHCGKDFAKNALYPHIRRQHPWIQQPKTRRTPSTPMQKCTIPGCNFATNSSLKRRSHVKESHEWLHRLEITCFLCNKIFSGKLSFQHHCMFHHNSEEGIKKSMLTCYFNGCTDLSNSAAALRCHRITHIVNGPNHEQHENEDSIEEVPHTLKRQDDEPITMWNFCKHCYRIFRGTGSFSRHEKTCKGEQLKCTNNTLRCDRVGCHEISASKFFSNLHKWSHVSAGDGFQCRVCGELYVSSRYLRHHNNKQHPADPSITDVEQIQKYHVLNILGTYEGSVKATENHLRFSCGKCHEKFGWRHSLLRHVSALHHDGHVRDRPGSKSADLKCRHCHLWFHCYKSRLRHIRIKHSATTKRMKKSSSKGYWCPCCRFSPSPFLPIVSSPDMDMEAFQASSTPVLMTCTKCEFATQDDQEAFIHVRDNMNDDIEAYPEANASLMVPTSYDYCYKCKEIFYCKSNYLLHLERKHYTMYIMEKNQTNPEAIDVINFYKYAAANPYFDSNDEQLAMKIFRAARTGIWKAVEP